MDVALVLLGLVCVGLVAVDLIWRTPDLPQRGEHPDRCPHHDNEGTRR